MAANLRQVLQALVADRPGTAEAWRRLGRLPLADDRLEDAGARLGRAPELRPADPDIMAALAA